MNKHICPFCKQALSNDHWCPLCNTDMYHDTNLRIFVIRFFFNDPQFVNLVLYLHKSRISIGMTNKIRYYELDFPLVVDPNSINPTNAFREAKRLYSLKAYL